jgi:spore coat protein U-like protein
MTRRARFANAALLLGTALLALPAASATDCFINAVAAAGFGAYDGTQNDAATTTITGSCTNNPPPGQGQTIFPVISLSPGQWGSYATRQMANGAARLNYNLYTLATRTVVWGDGSGSTAIVPAYTGGNFNLSGNSTLAFNNPNLTIYGRIPAGQNLPTGLYTDTITLTLTF